MSTEHHGGQSHQCLEQFCQQLLQCSACLLQALHVVSCVVNSGLDLLQPSVGFLYGRSCRRSRLCSGVFFFMIICSVLRFTEQRLPPETPGLSYLEVPGLCFVIPSRFGNQPEFARARPCLLGLRASALAVMSYFRAPGA